MSLRFKLLINTIVLVILTGILGGVMLRNENQVSEAASEPVLINKIVSGILDLDVRTDDLSTNYTAAGAADWHAKAQEVVDTLTSGASNFEEADSKVTSAKMKQDLVDMEASMTQYSNAQLGSGVKNDQAKGAIITTLEGQIQAALKDTFTLQTQEVNNLLQLQSTTRASVIVLCSLLMIVILISSFYLITAITLPINSLTAVIENISRGKLDTSIGNGILGKKDEIGALARAFDRTIVSLKLAMRDQHTSDEPADTASPSTEHK